MSSSSMGCLTDFPKYFDSIASLKAPQVSGYLPSGKHGFGKVVVKSRPLGFIVCKLGREPRSSDR